MNAHANPRSRSWPHKHYVVKLPLQLAARLEALCEMNSNKTRDQVIAELLGLGLTALEHHVLRATEGVSEVQPQPRSPIYLLNGPFSEFHDLVRKHHYALEQELAKLESEPARLADSYRLDDLG